MKSNRVLLVVLGLMILATSFGWKQAQNQQEELGAVHWGRDYAAAKKLSSQTGKPILILFQEVPG